MQAEMDLIRTAVNQGKVILGSCFGHQIIAGALFGMGAVRSRKGPEIYRNSPGGGYAAQASLFQLGREFSEGLGVDCPVA